MIDRKAVEAELREARRARIRAQAAERYLEMLMRRWARHPARWAGRPAPWPAAQPGLLAEDWAEAA